VPLNHENVQRGFEKLLDAGIYAITDHKFIVRCLIQRFNQCDNYHKCFDCYLGDQLHLGHAKIEARNLTQSKFYNSF